MVSKEQIKHVAELARLSFSDEELDHFTEQFDNIIDMVEQLNNVDTTGVPVMTQVTDLVNVLRDDAAQTPTPRAELMKNVPESANGLIKVPAIMEKED